MCRDRQRTNLLGSTGTPAPRKPSLSILLILSLLPQACGERPAGPLGTEAAGPVVWNHEWVLISEPAPAGFSEVNYLVPRADAAVTVFFHASGGPVRWDVHGHDGGLTIYEQGVSTTGEVRFVAPQMGLFSFLAEHAGAARALIRVQVTLRGDATVHSWYP